MGYAVLALGEVVDVPYGVDAPYGSVEAVPVAPDPDVIDALGEEIATLFAHVHAATHRLLVLIAEFDRLEGWRLGGHRSCAHWLAVRTGIDLGAAREKVRAARALLHLPLTGAAMSRGQLSFSQVRALTRVATGDNERELLELARGATTAQLERMIRAWRRGSRQDEAERERERHRSRTFSVFPDDDGMYVVRGRLAPEVGALLMRAVEAASDALFRESWVPGRSPEEEERSAAQRRADAVGLVAERALSAGFGGKKCGCGADEAVAAGDAGERAAAESGGASDAPSAAEDAAAGDREEGVGGGDAVERAAGADPCEGSTGAARGERAAHTESGSAERTCTCDTREAPISGTQAERYQLFLHVEPGTLRADGEPGRSELEDGTRISAETSRRLSCDCSVVRVTRAEDGSVLDVGRKTRTTPPALRRALEVRDRGCRFPGCGRRFTQAHHVAHWADGGATSLANCCLVCTWHHRLLHEGGWHVQWWGEGRPAFVDPRGGVHFEGGWRPPELPPGPVATLVRENKLRGADPDAWTAGARWEREADIPDAVYFRATGAV